MKLKKIACIYIPHIFIESENLKKAHSSPVVMLSGTSKNSIIIDLDPFLEKFGISKGNYLKSLEAFKDNVDICSVDYEYTDKIKQKIILLLKNFSPTVEFENYDRYYIDLTGTLRLFGRPIDTAMKIIGKLKDRLSLTSRVGIGNNILIASTASMLAENNAVYEVTPRSERLFIQQLPLSIIPLFPNSIKRQLLANYNLIRISEISNLSKNSLIPIAGKFSTYLYNISRGTSRDFLISEAYNKEIKVKVIPELISDDNDIRKKVSDTLFEVSLKLYNQGLYPGHIKLSIIYQDNYRFEQFIKKGISPSLFCTGLYRLLLPHLNKALRRRAGIKTIIIKLSEFKRTIHQLWLFSGFSEKDNLAKALTSIKKKYGKRYIKYGD